jgi:hypothetical protein
MCRSSSAPLWTLMRWNSLLAASRPFLLLLHSSSNACSWRFSPLQWCTSGRHTCPPTFPASCILSWLFSSRIDFHPFGASGPVSFFSLLALPLSLPLSLSLSHSPSLLFVASGSHSRTPAWAQCSGSLSSPSGYRVAASASVQFAQQVYQLASVLCITYTAHIRLRAPAASNTEQCK